MTQSRYATAIAVLLVLAIAGIRSVSAKNKDVEPPVIEIHSKKFAYEPAEITLHKGETYKLRLTSDDVPHSFRIKSLNLNARMSAGAFEDLLFTPEQAGDFKVDCGLYCGSGHSKMGMTVHVIDK